MAWSIRGWLCHLQGRALGTRLDAGWLPVDSLLPPDPLQFQPQTLPAHRFWIRWVTNVTPQLCWGFREAAEASALWSRARVGPGDLLSHRITSRPLEICPAPLEAAGKAPWSNFSHCARPAALQKELCSSSAASPCSPAPRNIPCLLPGVPLAETAAQKGGESTDPTYPRGRGAASLWESSPAEGGEGAELEGEGPRNPLGGEGNQELRSATSVVGEQRPHSKPW